jgi:hypothetical protein
VSESQFDELAPLHPHVVPGRSPIRAREVVERAERRGPRTTEFWLVALAIGATMAAVGYALGRRSS